MTTEIIEIDWNSFFNINLIVYTTLAFLFSVIVTILLVLATRPLNKRAAIAKKRPPEKLNVTYLRLIIFLLAEFTAFIADIFLVLFWENYKIPWILSAVFLTLITYKIFQVILKGFQDLGFNARGLRKSALLASKALIDRSIGPFTQELNNLEHEEKEPTDNKDSFNKKKSKVKYKSNVKNKLMLFLIIVTSSFIIFNAKSDTKIIEVEEITMESEIVGTTIEVLEYEQQVHKIILTKKK